MRKTAIATTEEKQKRSIGHTEYCNDPKCRGKCRPSKEALNLIDNLEANVKRAVENINALRKILKKSTRVSETQDALQKMLTSSTEIGSIPSLKEEFAL